MSDSDNLEYSMYVDNNQRFVQIHEESTLMNNSEYVGNLPGYNQDFLEYDKAEVEKDDDDDEDGDGEDNEIELAAQKYLDQSGYSVDLNMIYELDKKNPKNMTCAYNQ